MPKIKVTREQRNEMLVKDYREGKPVKEIVRKYGFSRGRLYQILHNLKVEMRYNDNEFFVEID
jgi:Mor family transcriptional regulator